MKKVADKLASFVAMNGGSWKYYTPKNPGDTPFKYIVYFCPLVAFVQSAECSLDTFCGFVYVWFVCFCFLYNLLVFLCFLFSISIFFSWILLFFFLLPIFRFHVTSTLTNFGISIMVVLLSCQVQFWIQCLLHVLSLLSAALNLQSICFPTPALSESFHVGEYLLPAYSHFLQFLYIWGNLTTLILTKVLFAGFHFIKVVLITNTMNVRLVKRRKLCQDPRILKRPNVVSSSIAVSMLNC